MRTPAIGVDPWTDMRWLRLLGTKQGSGLDYRSGSAVELRAHEGRQRTEWGTGGERIDQSRSEVPDGGWKIGQWLTLEPDKTRLVNLNLYSCMRVGVGDKSHS